LVFVKKYHQEPGLRWLIALASGLMLACAYPKAGIAGLAWIAPGLMLFAAMGATGGQAFRLGYSAGLMHYLVSLYWLLYMPFPLGAITGWLALSAYLAFYPAAWVWLCWRLLPEVRSDSPGSPGGAIRLFDAMGWPRRMLWGLSCAAFWVAMEMAIGRVLTGFPWNFLGVSQYQMLPLIQLAAWTGVYGLSFLMVWFSVSIASTAVIWLRQPARSRAAFSEIALPMTALVLVVLLGVGRLRTHRESSSFLKLALIQPSIPQTLIWDPKEDTHRFQKILQLSERALRTQPDLLVWPEAAIPSLLRYEPLVYKAVTNLAASHRVWMIVGADDAEPSQTNLSPDATDYFNASFLVDPKGQLITRYCKRRLVAFGEYVPLQPWLFFLKWFTPVRNGFTPGRGTTPFVLKSPEARISVLICFEDTFSQLARTSVDEETDFLINLTNNGWFGESAAQWQHAANAVFRAVENGRPLVRCANNGLTCWVDAQGRMRAVYGDESQDVYGAGFKSIEVPLLGGEKRPPTCYQKHGDWFGWVCVLVSSLLFIRIRLRRSLSRAMQA
jgi:apolipoprotein N-acyltransferase